MKIILKEDIPTLGKAGEVVKVADGYGRNFLIPKGLAAQASETNVKMLEHKKAQILKTAAKERAQSDAMVHHLASATCTISRRVGEQDKLYGSVGTKDIEHALNEQGFSIDKKQILLSEPLRMLGEYPVKIKLPAGKIGEIMVHIVAAES